MPRQASDRNGHVVPALKPGTSRVTTLSTSSAQSVPLDSEVIRIVADVTAFYRLNATATTADTLLPAGLVEFIRIEKGDRLNIVATGAGTMNITEME